MIYNLVARIDAAEQAYQASVPLEEQPPGFAASVIDCLCEGDATGAKGVFRQELGGVPAKVAAAADKGQLGRFIRYAVQFDTRVSEFCF